MQDNLGRIVAAERNATSAHQLARNLSQENAGLRENIARVTQQVAIHQDQIARLQQSVAMMRGTGPTQR